MQIIELKVDGMTCGSCVAPVIKALERVPGVQDVEVDLDAGIAHVRGEHSARQVTKMVVALGEAGFEAGALPSERPAHQRPASICGAGRCEAAQGRSGCCQCG